jgi:hypothetical protein
MGVVGVKVVAGVFATFFVIAIARGVLLVCAAGIPRGSLARASRLNRRRRLNG